MAWCLDIGTGGAGNVVGNAVCSLFKKVVEEVKLVIYLRQAISDMEGEVQRLNDLTQEISVELARVNMNPKSMVKGWLDRAGEAIQSSGSIGNDYEQHKNCLTWCPNCVCRYRIGRRIRDWKASVAELHLQRQSDFPATGEYGDPTPRTQVLVQNPESGSGRFVVDTRRSTQTQVVERWLTDEDSSIRRIGIQGMGGVGKSSLLDAINDSQRVRDSFELIIKVTVSRNPILAIQNSVADRLKLRGFQENSNLEERKEMLRSSLKNKKYLLLLDDMWAEDMWTIDELQDLGVSLNDTAFKILLTTRDKQVCARMKVQQTITVEPLLEEEGWQLFRSGAFENGNVPQEIEQVARDIAQECKGLPLALIVVAAAVAHHTELHEWEVALDQMKNVPDRFYDLHAGVDKKLFQRLKWSYDVLPDYLKSCFLYFAAYPEDEEMDVTEVIDIWISEGLVIGSRDSYLHDIGHSYMKVLVERCLIELVKNDNLGRIDSVKIHDVLRDLAIRIAEKEQRCHFKAGVGVSHFPSQEDLEGCTRLSLMRNALHSLPTTFACSSLRVLLLRENPGITEVPESFFSQLPSLRVLDLSKTCITSLPRSIGNLKYLACLSLSGCHDICELPESIGELKELQFLNLSHCPQLRCLPESISELKRLRALDIMDCHSLAHLPSGISEVVSLERLMTWNSAVKLSFEEANAERKDACLKDLQNLSMLRVFSANIRSPVKEGVMANWSRMRDLSLDFEEAVGQHDLPQDMQAMKDLETLALWYCNVERLPSWVIQFRKLAHLRLAHCQQLKELPAEFPCLRILWIFQCEQLEQLELGIGFPKLQEVTLNTLRSLECVAVGTVGAASGSGGVASPLTPMLKSLRVEICDQLKRLRGGWDKLNHLEKIEGSREWWDAIQCDDPNIKTSLESKYRNWPTSSWDFFDAMLLSVNIKTTRK